MASQMVGIVDIHFREAVTFANGQRAAIRPSITYAVILKA